MKQHDFESRLLTLWTTTRVPLTRANVMAYTKAPRQEVTDYLDEMVKDSLLAVDSDDDGELLWTVRGSKRPARGLDTLAEVDSLARLSAEVDRPEAPLATREQGLAPMRERKSVIASGALSFFLGPLGWLYAAPLKEALPVLVVYLVVASLVPKLILIQILRPLLPISAILGMVYAWRYNRHGRRMAILLGNPESGAPQVGRGATAPRLPGSAKKPR